MTRDPRQKNPLADALAAMSGGSGEAAPPSADPAATQPDPGQLAVPHLVPHRPLMAPRAARNPLFALKTTIPIFLTTGFIFLVAAVIMLASGSDGVVYDVFPRWTPVALLIGTVAAAGLAARNMWIVRRNRPR